MSDGKSFNIKKEHAQLSTDLDVLGSMSGVDMATMSMV
jgi:hypothetical protein